MDSRQAPDFGSVLGRLAGALTGGEIPFMLIGAQAIRRAVQVEVAGELVPFASGEDLLLHKLFAGRPRDLEDARGVVRRKGPELDWAYLERWAREFAEIPGREGLPEQVRRLREGEEG